MFNLHFTVIWHGERGEGVGKIKHFDIRWMGDRLGAGIIRSFRHSCPSWVKVCLRHHNISVRQLGDVREDLLLEETLMVMNES